jgi:hypothetical protein
MRTPFSEDLDRQIAMTHDRFVEAMAARLPAMPLESKERYFAVLTVLVGKLSDAEKPLRNVLQEMMAEAAGVILQEMGPR